MFALGMFASIYHPVGMAMLIEASGARGRTLAFNGVCGNLGVSLAAGVSALLATWLGWRAAFLVPAALCDRHRHRLSLADARRPPSRQEPQVGAGGASDAALGGGLVRPVHRDRAHRRHRVQRADHRLPKIVDERLADERAAAAGRQHRHRRAGLRRRWRSSASAGWSSAFRRTFCLPSSPRSTSPAICGRPMPTASR